MFRKLLKRVEPAKTSSGTGRSEEPSPIESAPPRQKLSPARSLPPSTPSPLPSSPAEAEEGIEAAGTSSELPAIGASRVGTSTPALPEPSKRAQEASFLGTGVQLRGALAFSGGLVLNCGFLGTVYAPEGIVRIGSEADVRADIKAMDLQVEGKVRGSLSVRNSLELRNGADVQGSIRCLRLQIAEEALFRGPCECFRPEPNQPEKIFRWPDLYGFFTTARVAAVRI